LSARSLVISALRTGRSRLWLVSTRLTHNRLATRKGDAAQQSAPSRRRLRETGVLAGRVRPGDAFAWSVPRAPDTETLMSTTGQNARAGRIAPQKDEGAWRVCEVLHTKQRERSVQALGPAPHVLARPPGDFRGALS
jgi:hypothetical protein